MKNKFKSFEDLGKHLGIKSSASLEKEEVKSGIPKKQLVTKKKEINGK